MKKIIQKGFFIFVFCLISWNGRSQFFIPYTPYTPWTYAYPTSLWGFYAPFSFPILSIPWGNTTIPLGGGLVGGYSSTPVPQMPLYSSSTPLTSNSPQEATLRRYGLGAPEVFFQKSEPKSEPKKSLVIASHRDKKDCPDDPSTIDGEAFEEIKDASEHLEGASDTNDQEKMEQFFIKYQDQFNEVFNDKNKLEKYFRLPFEELRRQKLLPNGLGKDERDFVEIIKISEEEIRDMLEGSDEDEGDEGEENYGLE